MKIKYYPYQPHCFAFGGFDMQLINALDSVKKTGIDAEKLDIWRREQDFDIIHLWGIGPQNYHIINWAKKSGKGIVATVLLPYYDTLRLNLSYYRHYFSSAQKQQLYYYSLVDKIVVVNDLQSDVLTKYFNIPISKIEVIPNIIEDKYFESPTFDFPSKYSINNYVLCTGNISSRKNQYNLAVACINLKLNLVLIGNILDGEESYGESLHSLINLKNNVRWIKELPKGSEELAAAYHNCSLFALPSKDETQPISALEATAMKKQLILMDKKYAYQSFYQGAILCKSPAVKDIESALLKGLSVKKEKVFCLEISDCKAQTVGAKYKSVYQQVMAKLF